MNEPSPKLNLNQRAEQELETTHQAKPESAAVEFRNVEEILRHDAATIAVPESVAVRLAESARNSPVDSWWRRWFRG